MKPRKGTRKNNIMSLRKRWVYQQYTKKSPRGKQDNSRNDNDDRVRSTWNLKSMPEDWTVVTLNRLRVASTENVCSQL